MTIRLHLACDDAAVRRALRLIAENDPRIEIAEDGARAPATTEDPPTEGSAPDGPLVPEWSLTPCAVDAVQRLLDEHPGAKIVVVPLLPSGDVAIECQRTLQMSPGALSQRPSTMDEARSRVERPLPSGERSRPGRPLTEREVQVLQLIADGLSSKEIAARLGISMRTVDVHRAHLKQKLRVQTIGDLVRAAIREGFVTA